jgi:hypothetical protein
MLCDRPHENEAAIVVAVGRWKSSRTAPALHGKWQKHPMFPSHVIQQTINLRDAIRVHFEGDASQAHH